MESSSKHEILSLLGSFISLKEIRKKLKEALDKEIEEESAENSADVHFLIMLYMNKKISEKIGPDKLREELELTQKARNLLKTDPN